MKRKIVRRRPRETGPGGPPGRGAPWIGRAAGALVLLLSAFLSPPRAEEVWDGGVVAADHETASRAGLAMLEKGGNAVDAAVATSFCLAVVRPYSCGLGGGGFLLLHLTGDGPGENVAIDYRERAPEAAGPDFFEEKEDTLASQYGGSAAGIPGTVAGLLYALEKYGSLDRADVLAPAIHAAEEGFVAGAHYAAAASEVTALFEAHPGWKERYAFTWERYLHRGEVKEGDRILIPEEAGVLRRIAEEGRDGFYAGPVGTAILRTVRAAGGAMTAGDLAGYAVALREPLTGRFADRTIVAMPPPSSGGITMLQILGIFERLWAGKETPKPGSAAYVHSLAEAMKHAFADRAAWLGDPEFVDVPVAALLAGDSLDARAASVEMGRTKKPAAYGTRLPPPRDGGTSHFSIVDRWGNGASGTESINNYFGSFVAVGKYGFLLNNTMDDFTTRRGVPNVYGLVQSDRNLPAPGKRPLSSMSPTIVLDERGIVAVAGGSGGPKIITGTLQVLLGTLLFDMDASEAVAARRFHHQWLPNRLFLEPGFGRDVQMALFRKGHSMENTPAVAAVQLVRRREGGYQAASDPRKGGVAAGRKIE